MIITSQQQVTQQQTRNTIEVKNYKPDYIFVVQLNDGRYAVGQAHNPTRRICAINSGLNPLVKEALQIYRIVGIQPQNEERDLISVVTKLSKRFGNDRVLAV